MRFVTRQTRYLAIWAIAVVLSLFTSPFGCGEAKSQSGVNDATTGPITFTKDIAPIVFRHCSVCHHPSESAPFSLLSYTDVQQRANQIVEVTASRYMPPWLPQAGYGSFVGERRLTDVQIEAFKQWASSGAPEGDRADMPEAPEYTQGWQLGQPDLVIRPDEPYKLAAGGSDYFRNMVVTVPIDSTRYVRAIEFRPNVPKAIHHAEMGIDTTDSSRKRDAAEPGPGYGGMDLGVPNLYPDGHFLNWVPGNIPLPPSPAMAWRINKGTDFIMQLHLQPTGKEESVQPSVGLFFADEPPTRHCFAIVMFEDAMIDIPPGESEFVVEDKFMLPTDVELIKIIPHAHYIGKDLRAYATLPDGTRQWLIWIKNWDFNWQDHYLFKHPVSLPRGTAVTMRFTYDNSEGNLRNPNKPPKRIVFGNNTTNEMASLGLQVAPRGPKGLPLLQEGQARYLLAKVSENDSVARSSIYQSLGNALGAQGKTDEAIETMHKALELRPDCPEAHYNLALLLLSQELFTETIVHLEAALETKPDYFEAMVNIGVVYHRLGRFGEAIDRYHEALNQFPRSADTMYNLANSLRARGDLEEAVKCYQQALQINPQLVRGHFNLAAVFHMTDYLDDAASHFRSVLAIEPNHIYAHAGLGAVLTDQGKSVEAVKHLQQAAELTDRRHLPILDFLAAAYEAAGRSEDASRTRREAMKIQQQTQPNPSATR